MNHLALCMFCFKFLKYMNFKIYSLNIAADPSQLDPGAGKYKCKL